MDSSSSSATLTNHSAQTSLDISHLINPYTANPHIHPISPNINDNNHLHPNISYPYTLHDEPYDHNHDYNDGYSPARFANTIVNAAAVVSPLSVLDIGHNLLFPNNATWDPIINPIISHGIVDHCSNTTHDDDEEEEEEEEEEDAVGDLNVISCTSQHDHSSLYTTTSHHYNRVAAMHRQYDELYSLDYQSGMNVMMMMNALTTTADLAIADASGSSNDMAMINSSLYGAGMMDDVAEALDMDINIAQQQQLVHDQSGPLAIDHHEVEDANIQPFMTSSTDKMAACSNLQVQEAEEGESGNAVPPASTIPGLQDMVELHPTNDMLADTAATLHCYTGRCKLMPKKLEEREQVVVAVDIASDDSAALPINHIDRPPAKPVHMAASGCTATKKRSWTEYIYELKARGLYSGMTYTAPENSTVTAVVVTDPSRSTAMNNVTGPSETTSLMPALSASTSTIHTSQLPYAYIQLDAPRTGSENSSTAAHDDKLSALTARDGRVMSGRGTGCTVLPSANSDTAGATTTLITPTSTTRISTINDGSWRQSGDEIAAEELNIVQNGSGLWAMAGRETAPRKKISMRRDAMLSRAAPSYGSNVKAAAAAAGAGSTSEREAMRDVEFARAALQPVDWAALLAATAGSRPKRRNVRISEDPQSVSARRRRERISDRIRVLQRLVPNAAKLDTASMLDEAIRYLKFLRSQVQALHSLEQTLDRSGLAQQRGHDHSTSATLLHNILISPPTSTHVNHVHALPGHQLLRRHSHV